MPRTPDSSGRAARRQEPIANLQAGLFHPLESELIDGVLMLEPEIPLWQPAIENGGP
jgi:hypothetical protein